MELAVHGGACQIIDAEFLAITFVNGLDNVFNGSLDRLLDRLHEISTVVSFNRTLVGCYQRRQ
ncbi:hypothetical protein [Actinoplanes sp. NPDC049802]|uniref:hypothetical protein n=1 Tax=Actinoplanes sp. NPDC049802 TaxID=3154742 RepID=UPI0033DF9789